MAEQRARGAQVGNVNAIRHGDRHRKRRLSVAGIAVIDGRTTAGREAKRWRAAALDRKRNQGPVDQDIRQRIDAATFYLWRALCLRAYIVADARKRGAVVNRRSGKLPGINDQYDTCMEQFMRISTGLELNTGGLDLARRIMLERAAREQNGHGKPRSKAVA